MKRILIFFYRLYFHNSIILFVLRSSVFFCAKVGINFLSPYLMRILHSIITKISFCNVVPQLLMFDTFTFSTTNIDCHVSTIMERRLCLNCLSYHLHCKCHESSKLETKCQILLHGRRKNKNRYFQTKVLFRKSHLDGHTLTR